MDWTVVAGTVTAVALVAGLLWGMTIRGEERRRGEAVWVEHLRNEGLAEERLRRVQAERVARYGVTARLKLGGWRA